jgi:DNA-binding NarL/FixJ family response regulator
MTTTPDMATGGGAQRFVSDATLPEPIAAALLRARALSPRERAVFRLLGLGYDNRSLSRDLDVSERTAKRHITAILAKLGLESRLQAGIVAFIILSISPRDPSWPEGLLELPGADE